MESTACVGTDAFVRPAMAKPSAPDHGTSRLPRSLQLPGGKTDALSAGNAPISSPSPGVAPKRRSTDVEERSFRAASTLSQTCPLGPALVEFPQPHVTSVLAAHKEKADDSLGGSGKRNSRSATLKLFEIKIFPATD